MTVKLSIIIPYYNEKDYLSATLDSLGQQTSRDFMLILVDNASDDGSADLARTALARYPDLDVIYLKNTIPGQLPTLQHGLAAVDTPYVASCDADTIYPSNYVAQCLKMFASTNEARRGPVVGVMAINLCAPMHEAKSQHRIAKIMRKNRIFSSQCHAGGYAQAYCSKTLKMVGGFESADWPYLLYDHELYERVRPHGVILYSPDHHCFPSDRRADRSGMGWNRTERMIYRFTPAPLKRHFFHGFLAKQFARRGLVQAKLRQRDF